jgi:hypothetical protein
MTKHEALTHITFEALNDGVASEHGVHDGETGLKDCAWYEIDYNALEKYLIETYGEAVGTILYDQYDDFDVSEVLASHHFDLMHGNI